MNEKYVLPNCQASVLCEDIRREITGMQTLVGVINAVPAPQIPIGFLKLCLWTRWCNGVGEFKQTAKMLAPDEKILGESSVTFRLKEMEAMATNVNLFTNIQFKTHRDLLGRPAHHPLPATRHPRPVAGAACGVVVAVIGD